MKISKRKIFNKLAIIYLIAVILIQSSIANATQGIFLNYSTSIKLSADLEYFKKTVTNQQNQIFEYKGIVGKLEEKSKLQDTKLEGIILDKGIQTGRANQLQDEYSKCTKELADEKINKPSRFTWFGYGFISAMVVGLAAIFAVK